MMSRPIEATLNAWDALCARLNAAGRVVPPLFLRVILAWEFYESGLMKLHGNNWFSQIQDSFPWPFSVISPSLSWAMATWFELGGALLLLFGLFTRFAALSLIVLTAVATAAVHWPDMWHTLEMLWEGYAITDRGSGNFKLPLLFIVMLLPLVFGGAGRLSLDHLLRRLTGRVANPLGITDLATFGLSFALLGVVLIFLIPGLGATLLALGALLLIVQPFLNSRSDR